MQDLRDKVAVVTGTANPSGIGLATCRRLGERGSKLVLVDLDGEGAERSASELREAGVDALSLQADMTDAAAVDAVAAAVYDRHGAVHVVVLNHADQTPGSARLIDPELDAWQRMISVNLFGVLNGVKAFVPRMIRGGEHGHVLATVSGTALLGVMYGIAGYVVSKSAIITLMECLHGQLRDAGADIRAGLVFPPLTRTMPMADMMCEMLNQHGAPWVVADPDEVAVSVVEAIEKDSFWAHATIDDDARLTGGKHRERMEWEAGMLRARTDAILERTEPDTYLWGPPALAPDVAEATN